jgi:hypothetical protein
MSIKLLKHRFDSKSEKYSKNNWLFTEKLCGIVTSAVLF